jgi:hypothetical protein
MQVRSTVAINWLADCQLGARFGSLNQHYLCAHCIMLNVHELTCATAASHEGATPSCHGSCALQAVLLTLDASLEVVHITGQAGCGRAAVCGRTWKGFVDCCGPRGQAVGSEPANTAEPGDRLVLTVAGSAGHEVCKKS